MEVQQAHVSPEFLNSSSLCLFKRIVSLSLVFAPPSLLPVIHSLALVSPPRLLHRSGGACWSASYRE